MAKKPDTRRRKTITVYAEPELRKQIIDAAKKENRSVGAMLAEIARRYFKTPWTS